MRLVIMAGGAGTRLYPLSTEEHPKQFVKIFDGESLYQKTIKRYADYFDTTQVVTLKKYEAIAKEQAIEIGYDVEIIVEPARKNTLAAITLAAMIDDEKMFVTPADHAMRIDEKRMKTIINSLSSIDDKIILYGIKPRYPATEYGYIQPGRKIGNLYEVKKFHEKPDENTAEEYIREGYFWNSGMFGITPKHFIKELEGHAPIYVEKVTKFLSDNDEFQYLALPDLSIDYGLLEKTKNLILAPLDVYWSDLGSYKAIYEYLSKDDYGNAVIGNVKYYSVKNSLLISDSELNVCCFDDVVAVNWGGITYVGPLNNPRAPKKFT